MTKSCLFTFSATIPHTINCLSLRMQFYILAQNWPTRQLFFGETILDREMNTCVKQRSLSQEFVFVSDEKQVFKGFSSSRMHKERILDNLISCDHFSSRIVRTRKKALILCEIVVDLCCNLRFISVSMYHIGAGFVANLLNI